MYDQETGLTSWIDWGLARSVSKSSRAETSNTYRDMLDSIVEDLTPQLQSKPRKVMQQQEDFFDFGSLSLSKTPNERPDRTISFGSDKTISAKPKARRDRMNSLTNQGIQNQFKTAINGARGHRRFATTGK